MAEPTQKPRQSSEQSQLKWKKKKWYKITAPEMFDSVELGETLLELPVQLVGKVVDANMMNLTRDMKKQNINMRFKVANVDGNTGKTNAVSYLMTPSSVRRLVRGGRDRIDDSFVITTSDGIYVRVKPLIITRENLSSRQNTLMRKLTQTAVLTYMENKTYEQFIKAVLDSSIVKEIKNTVQKIAPVRSIDIRAFSVLDSIKDVNVAEKFDLEVEEEVIEEEEAVAAN